MPFDPHNLTPAISLNRVKVVDLPGLELDPGLPGRTGFELLSARALTDLIRASAGALGVDPAADESDLHHDFDVHLRAGDGHAHVAAVDIARRLGRNLGWLLVTLRRGDAASRAVRAEWDDSYWAYWAGIRRVWLGGGLAAGALGPYLCDEALAVCQAAGYGDFSLHVSPYAAALPLVGAARRVPASHRPSLVFDFGSTLIKRAWATDWLGALIRLHRLSTWETGWPAIVAASADEDVRAGQLLDRMVAAMAESWREVEAVGLRPGPDIVASVAVYVLDGQPQPAQAGVYMELRRITDNVQRRLAREVSRAVGEAVSVTLVHDGTAAASAHAGDKRTAVITLGTALGIGFPPPMMGLRPLAPGFAVADGGR